MANGSCYTVTINARESQEIGQGRDLTSMLLTEGLNTFQNTASPVARIGAKMPEAVRLAAILATPVREQNHWMCGPIYWEALTFYDSQRNLCGVLNSCFECDRMINHQLQEVSADTATYWGLSTWLPNWVTSFYRDKTQKPVRCN